MRLGKYKWLFIVLTGVISFLLSMVLSLRDWPVPYVHDEFAYLLSAETFAKGRITNPAHEYMEHFETFHVVHSPSYQGKYPPGPSLFMALGILLTGHAIFGVWLSTALAVASVCWALTAWLSNRWAIMGGVLASLHPGIVILWGQSYWGGSVAVIGGALVFGGIRKLTAKPLIRYGIVTGIGFFILAHTRPFEGFIIGVMVVLFFLLYFRKKQPVQVITVILLILLMTLISVGFYNRAITGNAFKFPHQLWTEANSETSNPRLASYSGSPPGDIFFRSERLIWFYLGFWLSLPFLLIAWKNERQMFRTIVVFCIIWLIIGLIVPGMDTHSVLPFLILLQLVLMLQNKMAKWVRPALFTVLITGCISVFYTRAWPHYIAPVAVLILYLVVQSMRTLYRQRFLGISGKVIVLMVPLALLINASLSVINQPKRHFPEWDRLGIYSTPPWIMDRVKITEDLQTRGGKHLVFVRYPYWYNTHMEWVYNEADIDGARIVWAHDLGNDKNIGLIKYYWEREAWLLDLGHGFPEFLPYRH